MVQHLVVVVVILVYHLMVRLLLLLLQMLLMVVVLSQIGRNGVLPSSRFVRGRRRRGSERIGSRGSRGGGGADCDGRRRSRRCRGGGAQRRGESRGVRLNQFAVG